MIAEFCVIRREGCRTINLSIYAQDNNNNNCHNFKWQIAKLMWQMYYAWNITKKWQKYTDQGIQTAKYQVIKLKHDMCWHNLRRMTWNILQNFFYNVINYKEVDAIVIVTITAVSCMPNFVCIFILKWELLWLCD